MLNYVRQFFKIRVVFHTLYLRNEAGVAFLTQVTHYLTAVKILKESIEWKIFARTSLSRLKLTSTNHQHCESKSVEYTQNMIQLSNLSSSTFFFYCQNNLCTDVAVLGQVRGLCIPTHQCFTILYFRINQPGEATALISLFHYPTV